MLAPVLYLVRVWQQPGQQGSAAFRASVRPLDAERETLFTSPAELARYLAKSLAARPAPPPEASH